MQLAPGTTVTVAPPTAPRFTAAAPTSRLVVLPLRGPAGPAGPAGNGAATAQVYEHVQATAAASWALTPPGVGRLVTAVTVILGDSGVLTDVDYLGPTAVATFPTPTSGRAYVTHRGA